MSAGPYNLLIEQGATYRRVLRITDSAGNLVDFTGCTFRAMVRATYESASPLATFTCSLDAYGRIVILLTKEQTTAMPVNTGLNCRYVWDLEIETLAGEVSRLLQGKVTVSPEATK